MRIGIRAAVTALTVAALVAATGIESAAAASTRLVDVGGGRKIALQCRGHGSPTVVLVSGAGGAHDEWTQVADAADPSAAPKPSTSAVFPRVARFTRVCAYDRPGTTRLNDEPGLSTPVPQPTTAQAGAVDLRALLKAAGERGPYVVVGASWGGMITNLFARENPTKVAGLVFVDGASDFFKDTLTPEQWAAWMQLIATSTPPGHEAPDYEAAVAAIRAAFAAPGRSRGRPHRRQGVGPAARRGRADVAGMARGAGPAHEAAPRQARHEDEQQPRDRGRESPSRGEGDSRRRGGSPLTSA